jgi:two-component system NtrC family sensor kinase
VNPTSAAKRVTPESAKGRLAVIFVLASTLMIGLFGGYSYYSTQQLLHEQNDELKLLLSQHIAQPVANALWVYDVPRINAVLDAELSDSVQILEVFDENDKLVTQRSGTRLSGASALQPRFEVFFVELPIVAERRLGKIKVSWSDQRLQQTLRASLWLTVLEILGVNVTLLGVLWFGIDRTIFQRLSVLQRALDHATGLEHAADIVALPVTVQDEFGTITRSINAITQRLGGELESGRESEEEARAALNNLQTAQDGLVQAEKMAALGRLVAGIAHELNTPIGNVLLVASSYTDAVYQVRKKVETGELTRSVLTAFFQQSEDAAQLLVRSASRAAELIQNFKQVAVDQSTEQMREFDLAQQISEVLSVIAHVLAKSSVKLVVHLAPDIPMHSYPGPLGQVLTNLVMNSITHGFGEGQAGVITVSSVLEGDRARITVTDDGVGIPEQNIEKIFDPFFTTKMGQGGTGLGLNIVHNIVYGPLRGRMSVKSTVGVGTSFTLLLPLQVVSTV